MNVDALLQQIDPDGTSDLRADGRWAVWPNLDVRKMAATMIEHKVHFVTATAVLGADDTVRLLYHWSVDSQLITMETTVLEGRIPTISDLLPAADWVEREIRDYYGVEFTGRTDTPPLVLRAGDPPGLFSRTADLGHEANPAQTARAQVADVRGDDSDGAPAAEQVRADVEGEDAR